MEWKDAGRELPSPGETVLIFHEGQYGIGSYLSKKRSHVDYAWILQLNGRTFSPYATKLPLWWAPIPPLPEGIDTSSVRPSGEDVIYWRNSPSDLFTDVRALFRDARSWEQFAELVMGDAPSPVVSMLLWCPECSERHVDRGVWSVNRHHTHACQFCGHVWRPAVECTRGVQFLPGFKDADSPRCSNG